MSDVQTNHGSAPQGEVNYWRSLDQLAGTSEFQDLLHREFPEGIADLPDEPTRRSFLGAIAASVALAGLTSCRKPVTPILPFNRRPEGFKDGIAQHYATALTRGGYAIGVLVRSNDGRPGKIEGNPLHPSSLGGSDARLQGELLEFYDPDRSQSAWRKGAAAVEAAHGNGGEGHAAAPAGNAHNLLSEFHEWWKSTAKTLVQKQGEGLRFLCAPTASPAMADYQAKFTVNLPRARFHTWEPLHRDTELAGSQAAFGKAFDTHLHFENADVVVSFDHDFLALDGNNLVNARNWAKTRRSKKPGDKVSRLYVVESTYSTTGTSADHRFRLKAGDVPAAVFALASLLGIPGEVSAAAAAHKPDAFVTKNGKKWLEAIAKDLLSHNGRALVAAGPRQPAAVHAAVHAINAALGAVGKTISYTPTPAALADSQIESIRALKADIDAGKVEILVCLGTNPAHDAPADLGFEALLKAKEGKKVATTIHLGQRFDETASLCDWHFNLAHELEAWGDGRAHDGTITIQQPLVAPLHGGISALEFIGLLGEQTNWEAVIAARDTTFGHDLVRSYWKTKSQVPDFDAWWARAVHDGVIANSAYAPETPALSAAGVAAAIKGWSKPAGDIEVSLRPCAKLWDGRYANNSWLQELPDPLTKLTWDNAALISLAFAKKLGVDNGDMLVITAGANKLEVPAWILPGHADDSVTIALGYGRDLAHSKVSKTHGFVGGFGSGGFNAYGLRTSDAQWLVGAKVGKGDGNYKLVVTQEQGTMAGRAIVRESTAATFAADPDWATKMSSLDHAARLEDEHLREKDLAKSLWVERYDARRQDPEVMKSPYQWGMVIDLNTCTGCSACLVACFAENNIPMVGKTQVARNREMTWIRMDRYFASKGEGNSGAPLDDKLTAAEDPQVFNMPVPCMQCENAPCESVCPVAATTHSPDGLNDMVYNRCVGTRYCSNNCPYKVRRFNFLDYLGAVPETRKMAFNPDVTVRMRGVMEKCTYCVQRINGGRITAKKEKRKLRDGEVQPACAQSCPTEAIAFGNILDKESKVAKDKASPLNYGMLSDLNTKPRTTYLGRVRNPNPELA